MKRTLGSMLDAARRAVNEAGEAIEVGRRDLRRALRTLRQRAATPAGVAGLVVLAFVGGLHAAVLLGYDGPSGEDLRVTIREQARQIEQLRGSLATSRIEVDRLREIQRFSSRYGIDAGLAGRVYDAALAEGLSPELGFRLVRMESSFRQRAVSSAGAVGYTQIKPSTALWLEPGLTRDDLFDGDTNLRLGFRYLRLLLDGYDDDVRLALLAYNQGPGRVGAILAMGRDPANGYARTILGRTE